MEVTLTQLGQIALGSIIVCAPLLVWMARRLGLSAAAWGVVGVLFPFNAIAVAILLVISLMAQIPALRRQRSEWRFTPTAG